MYNIRDVCATPYNYRSVLLLQAYSHEGRYSQESKAKDRYQPKTTREWHRHYKKKRYWDCQDVEVTDDIEDCRKPPKESIINIFLLNSRIPGLLHWRASEDIDKEKNHIEGAVDQQADPDENNLEATKEAEEQGGFNYQDSRYIRLLVLQRTTKIGCQQRIVRVEEGQSTLNGFTTSDARISQRCIQNPRVVSFICQQLDVT